MRIVICVNPHDRIVVGLTAYFKSTVYDRIDLIQKCLEPSLLKG